MELVGIHRSPVPDGATVGVLRCEGGVGLRYSWWAPTSKPTKGTICLFPGRGEFIEKYFETIADLRRRGFYVAMLDWRGQGGSTRQTVNPRKGHIWEFSQYESDLHGFMTAVVLPDLPKPYFAVAQSMGGHILLRHGLFQLCHFDRMIILAPMLELTGKILRFPRFLVKATAFSACWTGFAQSYVLGRGDAGDEVLDFETNRLTHDRARFDRWIALLKIGAHLGSGGPTYGWLRAALSSMDQLAKPGLSQNIKVPTLILTGGMDEVVSNRAIKNFSNDAKNISVQVISHAKHEILMERDVVREQFWGAFDQFIPGTSSI